MAKVVPLQRDARDLDGLVAEPMGATEVMALAVAHAERGGHGAMATVIERHGSAPSTPGQKIWVSSDGRCAGTIGGGAIERDVMLALAEMARDRSARHTVRELKLGAELGMCCGGRVLVLLEPIACRVPCLIVGGGHVGSVVAPLLARLGFAVTVVDARDAWGREGRIEGVTCVVGDYDDAGEAIDPAGVFLTMTHDHALDQEAIEWALRRGFAFVGGVGSRAKAQRTRDRLAAKGFAAADIARVQMPLGVPIGARLPDELAVSIAAALVAWRRGKMLPDGA